MSGVVDFGKKLAQARETRDGIEVGGKQLYISPKELDELHKDYESSQMNRAGARFALSQLRIGAAGAGLVDQKVRFDLVQMRELIETLREAHGRKEPFTSEQLYQRYVARVAAAMK